MVAIDAKPRKLPSQARSRATVVAIIEATAQVLLTRGYDGTTTGRVAERAGVSVGSLYQYFPNKEALVAALIDAHIAKLVDHVRSTLDQAAIADLTLEQSIPLIVHTLTDVGRIEPALHKVLNEQVPRVGRLAEAMAARSQIHDLLQGHLQRHAPRLQARDPHLLAVVVGTVVEALVHGGASDHPELLPPEVIAREAIALLSGYLLR